ncbi:hypothetical protein NGM33_14020 [Nocardiopsis dassonvillei]|uniref:hypothetical protein n=1 Tax=Nocardiopsis dassonvillei TaxID=2014 RepID=UPI0020A3217B|nr:hypothetical protein [Nocardiopsis dassonvillei]MCP3014450.1 hypothetical protein [Nocardiopsis dassonvillei]
MKFDIVRLDQDGGAPPPQALLAEEVPDRAEEASAPHPGLGIQRSSEYMRLRARTDLARVRSALNRMLHTVEAARAGSGPLVGSGPDDGPGSFRPEAFRSRPAPEKPREQRQEESP